MRYVRLPGGHELVEPGRCGPFHIGRKCADSGPETQGTCGGGHGGDGGIGSRHPARLRTRAPVGVHREASTGRPARASARGPCAATGGGPTRWPRSWCSWRFVVYATWRAFANSDYYAAPYLSPFYSPCLTELPARRRRRRLRHAVRLVEPVPGPAHPDLPAGLPAHLLLLPQGLLPRRSGCRRRPARSPSRTSGYTGETRFPLILQNVHRYFLYVAVLVALRADLRHGAGVPATRDGAAGPHGPRHAADARQHRA